MAFNNLMDDLVKYLIDAQVAREKDGDIFYNYTPKDPDNIISLNEYASVGTANFTNTSVRSVQIMVRDRSNLAAQDKAWEIYDVLNTNDHYIYFEKVKGLINLRTTPSKIHVDDKNRYVWVFNVGITYNYK